MPLKIIALGTLIIVLRIRKIMLDLYLAKKIYSIFHEINAFCSLNLPVLIFFNAEIRLFLIQNNL